jgi:hypothetical protein
VGARRAGNKLAGNRRICGDQRPGQAAAARAASCIACSALRYGISVAHRAEGFGGVDRRGFIRLRAEQQGRREERAAACKSALPPRRTWQPAAIS